MVPPLYALNPTGTLKWRYDTTGDTLFASPGIAVDGTIYIGSHGSGPDDYSGNFYAIRPDGMLKCRYAADAYIGSPPAIGADGTVYVGTMSGKLYAFGPGPVAIGPRLSLLTRPVVPAHVPRGRYFITYGYVAPQVGGKTKLYFYRKVAKHWVRYRIVNVSNHPAGSTRAKYVRRYRLPLRGSWYVKAYFRGTAGVLAAWSVTRTFSVQ